MAIYLLSKTFRKPTRCVMTVGSPGCELPLLSTVLKEATICRGRQRIAAARIFFDIAVSPALASDAALEMTQALLPGEPIQLDADFGDTRELILRGFISAIHTQAASDTAQIQVLLTCFDDAARLMGEPTQRLWGGEGTAITDHFVVNAIIQKYGLLIDPNSATGSQPSILIQDDNDWYFLRNRAAANDYELLFQDGWVYFGPRRVNVPPQAPIVVHAHCQYFQSSQSISGTTEGCAEGELDGTQYGHVLRVGEPVKVEAQPVTDTGLYYVDTVTDRFTQKTYRQTFKLLPIDWEGIALTVKSVEQPSLFYQTL